MGCTFAGVLGVLAAAGCGGHVEPVPDRSGPPGNGNEPSTLPCGAGSVAIAELSWARYIAVADNHVYFADPAAQTLGKVPKCGGPMVVLGTVSSSPLDLAVGAGFLYATVQGDAFGEGQIVRVPTDGGAVAVLEDSVATPEAVTIDGTAVYYQAYRGISRLPLTGGKSATLAPAGSTYGSFPIDDSYVYWVGDAIGRAPKVGGDPEELGRTPDDGYPLPWCAEVDETHVYWTEYMGSAYRMRKTGGTIEQIASTAAWRCMTLDATHAYLARDDGPVVAVAKETLVVVELDVNGATDVKVDEHYAYAAQGLSPGTLWRIEKPR